MYGRLLRASVVSELALEWPHPGHPAFRRPDAPPEVAEGLPDTAAQLAIRATGSADVAAGIVAYALVRTGSEPIYFRQLFVRRGLRRTGVGRAAVKLILGRYGDGPVDVDALAANEPALRFWRAMGFAAPSCRAGDRRGQPACREAH